MKDEEYMADFCLVSRRTLSEYEHQIFKFHYLLGADWKLCCRRLNIDRGTFFHAVYRVQEKLGRIYRELQPYPLFPLDEYFYGLRKNAGADQAAFRVETIDEELDQPPRFPYRKAA